MVWMIQNAEHAFSFAFSCSEILFVISCLLSLTVREGKQSLMQKGVMGKVGWMNRSLEQKLGLRNRIKQATKPGQDEHPKWDLASACRLSLPRFNFQTRHSYLGKGKKSLQILLLVERPFESKVWEISHLKGKDSKQEQRAFFSLLQLFPNPNKQVSIFYPGWASSG